LLAQRIDYIVAPADGGAALGALAERIAGDAGARCVARGGAWLDGRRALDPAQHPAAGAALSLRLPPPGGYAELELAHADLAYEDAWLVALHKRQGWYVGATPWDVHGNALAALRRFLAARDGLAPPLHLAHQLDRDTSGLLLIAKAPAVKAALHVAFASGHVAKQYRCLCAGAPLWGALELRTGHGRAAGGRWRIYARAEVGRALPDGGGRVKEAHSSLAVERRLPGAALLRVTLHTGRTHQIRLHAAHAGHPLLGDTRYGGPASFAGLPLAGQLLHAGELRLPHPVTGATLALESPLPEAFAQLLDYSLAPVHDPPYHGHGGS
jgi:23S rRNA pseudouridine1911/1915/1917 synthase